MTGSASSWPSKFELDNVKKMVAEISGAGVEKVKIVVSPYRICPLGAHIDHQGGTVLAMTINKGILLGFVPSSDPQVVLQSAQFEGEVKFSVDEIQVPRHTDKSNGVKEEEEWGSYAKGAVYALQQTRNSLNQGQSTARLHHVFKKPSSCLQKAMNIGLRACGITGFICGAEGLDSSGLSSSAAAGIAYLLALESANNLSVSPTDNIEYDRLIENDYLGLRNGILDQSAILLSRYGCLTCMDCKTKKHKLINPPEVQETKNNYKILLAFSGLKEALTTNPGYNRRVEDCQEAAMTLLQASGKAGVDPILSNVEPEDYESYKYKLKPDLAKRAEHYFSENKRVQKGLEAWASGNLEEFGELISASGLSSIQNYECGCEPLIQLREILLKAPGVYGARFSGAGFRGCCVALVRADCARAAASFVREEYFKLQPDLASKISENTAVVICDAGDCAHAI